MKIKNGLSILQRSSLADFFMSRWYPVLVATLGFISHVTAAEAIFASLNLLIFAFAITLTRTARPIIPAALGFVFYLSLEHGPGVPNFSDYAFTSWRLIIFIPSAVIVALAIVTYFVRARALRGINLKNTPIIPYLIFTVGIMLGGAFCSSYDIRSLGFSALTVVAHVIAFFIFYLGLREEKAAELIDYITFVAATVAVMLLSEVGYRYIARLVELGEVVKGTLYLGWGTANMCGMALAVLIPVMFVGITKSRRFYIYFAISVLLLFGIALTGSRAALLFGALAFLAASVIAAFTGERQLFFRIFLSATALVGIVLGIIFRDSLFNAVIAFFADNGRYEVWWLGIANWLEAPIFGKGFFGLAMPDDPNYFRGTGFTPFMAHNTLIELLSATGIFGLICYLAFRASTVLAYLKRPTVTKSYFLISVLVLLGMSMLENYIFAFWPAFLYSLSLVIFYRDARQGK